MILPYANNSHKLCNEWRVPMRIETLESSNVFIVESLVDGELFAVHAKRMTLYPVTSMHGRSSNRLRQQAMHYTANYHIVGQMVNVCKGNREYELRIE